MTDPVHVVWWTAHPKVKARTFWDQAIVQDLLARSRHELVEHDALTAVPDREGAVVIVPGRFQDGDASRLNEALERLRWALVIVTSDEEGTFPTWELRHPHLRLWVQYPRPERHGPEVRRLPLGPTTDTPALRTQVGEPRPLDWYFAGQVTHHRRQDAARAILGQEKGLLVASSRFAGGLPQDLYLQHLAEAKVVLAPSGPVHPDSFRLWEALEAVALPLADAEASHYRPDVEDYWTWLLGGPPPFPVVDDWATVREVLAAALDRWPGNATRAAAWWQRYKRRLAWQLDDDITALSARPVRARSVDDLITAVVTTSPIPTHPSTDILDATLASIRARLPDAEILVVADGCPPGLEHRRSAYEEYLHRVTWTCAHRWDRVTPIVAEEWRHQALTVKAALPEVRTPLMLFAEHDTPLDGEIDWEGITRALMAGPADVIRLHHEDEILAEHGYLMLDTSPQDVCGVPLLRCAQWSQRPHLAVTDVYRQLLATYFGEGARTMIEDCLHGVFANAFDLHGEAGWERVPLWMYAPAGGMRRSTHLDGRAGDPKGDMTFEYPGATPEGAPRAMSERSSR